MDAASEKILSILDSCCDSFTFPMLDNGYVYLAGTRLSLYRSANDWAMVIEVFGFSPRSGLPDTHIHTFASTLYNRDTPERYVKSDAFDNYLANNPNNESRFVYPIDAGDWQDTENDEIVAKDAKEIVVRGKSIPLPAINEYELKGVTLEQSPRVQVFELCRFLADVARESILANEQERSISVLPEMSQILQLEDWHHPNIVDDEERPSRSETFRQLAQVLVTGDVRLYSPSIPSNTHWRNWPDAGRL